jgi:phosphoribosyl 1,2-cyclic phosphate phosphodiesterase
MAHNVFTFMGTAAGCGVPSFFCDCPACQEARLNPKLSRGDCGCLVRTFDGAIELNTQDIIPSKADFTLAIDTPPDARHQLIREQVKSVDAILFTHCHFDHIGGLGEYEYMVQLKHGGKKLPVYGSPTALQGIRAEFHYMDYCLEFNELLPYETINLGGVKYTALPVQHAPGTYGYLIETSKTRMFYASDTGPLPEETSKYLYDLDYLALDSTFWGNNWNPNDHHSIQESIAEGLSLNSKKIYLTHMCMHYDTPITYKELIEYLNQYDGRVEPAMDGLSIPI